MVEDYSIGQQEIDESRPAGSEKQAIDIYLFPRKKLNRKDKEKTDQGKCGP